MIDDKHPLLVSLDCLKDDNSVRPTAEQLLLQLSGLRESKRFQESAGGRGESVGSGEEVKRLQRELEQAVRRAEVSEQLVSDFQQSLNQKDEVIRSKDEALHQKERQIEDLQKGWGERWSSEAGTGLQHLRLQFEKEPPCPIQTFGETSAVRGKVIYFSDEVSKSKILQYNTETGEWVVLKCPKMFFSIAVVK